MIENLKMIIHQHAKTRPYLIPIIINKRSVAYHVWGINKHANRTASIFICPHFNFVMWWLLSYWKNWHETILMRKMSFLSIWQKSRLYPLCAWANWYALVMTERKFKVISWSVWMICWQLFSVPGKCKLVKTNWKNKID